MHFRKPSDLYGETGAMMMLLKLTQNHNCYLKIVTANAKENTDATTPYMKIL